MNWEAIGAIGETAGAIGVIVTLLYLSLQIRQNTRATRVTAIQTAAESSAHFTEQLAIHADLSDIFWLGMFDPESLNSRDFRRFVSAMNAFMRREAVNYRLYKEGHLPEQDWQSRRKNLAGIIQQPGTRLFLEMAQNALPPDFVELATDMQDEEPIDWDEVQNRMVDFDKA